ncbi:MAG: DUF364 domain-containing protein [bacterium]|nr:DUF364 domain-containing protein [bacterium]
MPTMIKTGDIAARLYSYLHRAGEDLRVEEVRIGLGYVGVRIEGKQHGMGLAAVLRAELTSCCSVLDEAGHLAGLSATTLLKRLVDGKNPLEKALGLATANALLAPRLQPLSAPTSPLASISSISTSSYSSSGASSSEGQNEALQLINLTPQDRVAMIGLFTPLVPAIERSGASLAIIERDASRGYVLDQKTKETILQECTVAIITATSLLNNTLEEVLNGLRTPRSVLLLGPSTPLCAEVFRETPVTHLGGSAVIDSDKVMQIISEGGGTKQLRPFVRFITLAVT